MSNDEKFAKTIDDEELDEVAGGTKAEAAKDAKFLKALGSYSEKEINTFEGNVESSWGNLGIVADVYPQQQDKYKNTYKKDGVKISRNDAMIYAMRAKGKYLNLEDYV